MANFVKEVKKGMILFLFEFEKRQLFGVYWAISDGGMNIVPHAFSSSGKQFCAQVQFVPIWCCSPLSENEFRDAIRENYFSARKFHFGLSDEQVHRLLRLFSSRKLKRRSLSRGYPRSLHGIERVKDDMFPIEHRGKDEDIIDSAEHGYYNDKKRRMGYDRTLSRNNAAEDELHVHSLTEELGFSGGEWSSLSDRVKREHKIRRTVHDAKVARDQIVKENNIGGNFGLCRSNELNGKPSDSIRTRLGNHYAGFLSNNCVDKTHIMDNYHEPSLSWKNKSDPFWNNGNLSDDWQSSSDDRVGKKSHLDPDINSTIVSERFVNSQYNQKGMCKDGRFPRRDISRNESKFRTGLRREFDHQEATADDVCFLSRRKGANEKCVDSFLIPAASNENNAYAGAEVGSYPMNDFDGLVPVTENFQRPLTEADCTACSPCHISMSSLVLVMDKLRLMKLNRAQTLCKCHLLPIFMERITLHCLKRGLESASGGGKMILLQSHDELNTLPLDIGISEAMEPNRSGSLGYRTAFIPSSSISPQLTRDDISEGETWRYSSQVALGSITRNSISGNYRCACERLGDEHVIWHGSDATHVGRRCCSLNANLLVQGNVLTNLDHTNRPGADIVNDEYGSSILTSVMRSDSRNSRISVFSRLSLAPKVHKPREQEADHSMSFDEHYMDTSVDEIMNLLYKNLKIVPKKPLNRKPFIREVGSGESNRSGKHAAVVKNDTEQPGDSMTRVLSESAKEVLEETTSHVLAETRMVDFKRRRETN
ncbi:hypothetical protein T459_06347 [Capsicum annuum]|uniref:DCD domain-containing protein n=1 Tax=Capsicum annuum TaxID=4072 RepID=A0A2G3AAJ1_CAPAN|nr:putative ankyrin repeat-containing protein-like [Capsicum annuum]PHT91234.1 hypothetical protein T459_06347 [Capsicum annuum]